MPSSTLVKPYANERKARRSTIRLASSTAGRIRAAPRRSLGADQRPRWGSAMADQTKGSIEINGTPAAVMAEIGDYESYPEWSGEIKKVEVRKRDAQKRGKHVYYEVAQGPLKAD